MAHEIHIEDGKASMMYVGEEPWHGLGTKLDQPATAEEAIKAAGLNWSVCKKPVEAVDGNKRLPLKNIFAIVREDKWSTGRCPVFGIVGEHYTPLQNSEAFRFFDPIVGKNAAVYHTAGALGKGERVWILAKLPSTIHVIGDDIAEKYLLLSNSHDGNSSVQIKFTPVRVVCQNTLTMALSQGPTLRVPHTKDLPARLKQSERTLGLIHMRFAEIEDCFKAMAKVQTNSLKLSQYLQDVFPEPTDPDNERSQKRVTDNRLWARYFFENGKGNRQHGVRGTLWAAYNGVTELVDHRQTGQTSERRLNSVWFGDGYLLKARAFKIATGKIAAWMN